MTAPDLPDPTPMEATSTRIRIFPESHPGPFVVYIREVNKPMMHIKISMYIHKTYTNSVLSCEKLRDKMKITLSTRDDANRLPFDAVLKDYHVSIPSAEVEIHGVIYLPIENDIDDITQYGKGRFNHSLLPSIPILDATRMKKRKDTANPNAGLEDLPLVKI